MLHTSNFCKWTVEPVHCACEECGNEKRNMMTNNNTLHVIIHMHRPIRPMALKYKYIYIYISLEIVFLVRRSVWHVIHLKHGLLHSWTFCRPPTQGVRSTSRNFPITSNGGVLFLACAGVDAHNVDKFSETWCVCTVYGCLYGYMDVWRVCRRRYLSVFFFQNLL